jgi:hypothetical protein
VFNHRLHHQVLAQELHLRAHLQLLARRQIQMTQQHHQVVQKRVLVLMVHLLEAAPRPPEEISTTRMNS